MENYHRVKELFHTALERESDQRAAFLDAACAADKTLRAEVESMIACHEQAESFIEAPAFEVAAELLTNDVSESIEGRHIGPYRIIREIGRGGMGAVHLAVRDDDQYRKQVAIKLIKRGVPRERGSDYVSSSPLSLLRQYCAGQRKRPSRKLLRRRNLPARLDGKAD